MTATDLYNRLASQLPDSDPYETRKWLESVDGLVDHAGSTRTGALLRGVLQRARERHVGLPDLLGTDYVNTIPPAAEPEFPGDESTERRLRAYDPAYAFELGHIVRDALRRMYGSPHRGEDPNVFYYLTVYNEPIAQPTEPEDVDVNGILAGMHCYSPAPPGTGPRAQLLASGIAVPWALEAQRLLEIDWGVRADVWSVTSWTELRRKALAVDEWNRAHPDQPAWSPYVTRHLTNAPVVAVSDWMRAVPDQIAPFVPADWCSLGTDGFGRSDTRPALRGHFGVDAISIVLRTLEQLIARRDLDSSVRSKAITMYQLDSTGVRPSSESDASHG